MSIPTIQGVAGILTEPAAEHTPSGTAILKLFIAMNDSKFNEQSNQWETTKQFTVEAVAWESTAERLGNILAKGDQIYIEGRLETQSWEDKNGGGKRSKPVLTIRTVRKLERAQSTPSQGAQNVASQLGGKSQGWSPKAQEDPWGAPSGNPSAGWGNGADNTEEPAF